MVERFRWFNVPTILHRGASSLQETDFPREDLVRPLNILAGCESQICNSNTRAFLLSKHALNSLKFRMFFDFSWCICWKMCGLIWIILLNTFLNGKSKRPKRHFLFTKSSFPIIYLSGFLVVFCLVGPFLTIFHKAISFPNDIIKLLKNLV